MGIFDIEFRNEVIGVFNFFKELPCLDKVDAAVNGHLNFVCWVSMFHAEV